MTNLIQVSEAEGKTYYSTTARGVEYTAYELCGEWFVSTRRLALNRNMGGGKYFATLADVANGCKAFAGLVMLTA